MADSITTNDGVRLSYTRCGSGPALVLIHGWSGSHRSFQRNIEALSAHFTVIAYDQRFHGASDRPSHGFHVARLAADLRAVIEQLQLADVSLLGTSMGCSVIWSYLELFGDAGLKSAVFVDQAPLQNKTDDWAIGSKGCYDAESLAALQAALHADMAAFADGNLECCATQPLPGDVCADLKAETLRCRPGDLARLMADHTQLDWRPQLPRVALRCLNCIGCQSGVFPVEGCEAVHQLIPDCQAAYFKACNHWLYLEAPDAFNRVVSSFLLQEGQGNLPEGVARARV